MIRRTLDAREKMQFNLIRAFAIGALAVGTVAIASAQQSAPAEQSVDSGKYEYDGHCAACHGSSGAGDGPYSSYLNKPIPDLTSLSKKNGGAFPFERVYEIIDGRQKILAHGSVAMPIWGRRFRIEAGRRGDDYGADLEAVVRARILALTEYVYRLQAK
jgi:mono/diheme cytochrome c family protein